MFQQMGFGLAVAVLLDATVVRTIIVPAAMELLGDWNWYLPRWLAWLPNVSVDGVERRRVAATSGASRGRLAGRPAAGRSTRPGSNASDDDDDELARAAALSLSPPPLAQHVGVARLAGAFRLYAGRSRGRARPRRQR